MTKLKAFFLVSITSIFLSGCGPSSTTTVPPTSPPPSSPTIAPTLATWTDPAGFTFQYPDGLTINNHPEDSVNYANLELDSVKVLMQDNTYKSLAAWANNPKAIDTVLGDKEALKFQTADKLTLGAVDNDVLVTIEAPISQEKLFNQIVSSFEFFYPTPTAAKQTKTQTQPPAEENILEEE